MNATVSAFTDQLLSFDYVPGSLSIWKHLQVGMAYDSLAFIDSVIGDHDVLFGITDWLMLLVYFAIFIFALDFHGDAQNFIQILSLHSWNEGAIGV